MFAAASQGLCLHHRQKRAYAGTGRLLTGRPSMNRRISSAQFSCDRVPIGRVLGQGRGDDRRQVGTDPPVNLVQGHRLLVLDLAEQLVRIRPIEDRPQSQQFVQGRAEGVDVVAALEPLPCNRSVALM